MLKNKAYKIIFTGPESSGKTTLTKQIAEQFGTNWLGEYARNYLNGLGRPYKFSDLVSMAHGQLTSEKTFINNNPNAPYHFFDTSLLVLKCWSIFKYGFYNIQLEKMLHQNLPDYYFLCDWQIPWEYDPMRENPEDRAELYTLYKKELIALNVPFFEVKGSIEERIKEVKAVLKTRLK